MYAHMEKKDTVNRNFIVLGPWNHGQWGRGKGDSLGKISFGSATGLWFRDLQKKWFDYWLKDEDKKGTANGTFDEATCFQTGSNVCKTYKSWPQKDATIKKIYAAPGHHASFSKPTLHNDCVSFFSTPANPAT